MFDESAGIMKKTVSDKVFYSVQDLTAFWGRFIDDVFNLFRGNYTQAEWYFQKLNDIFPGQVIFKWEHSLDGGIFLNVQLFINRETQKIETMFFCKAK